NPDAVLCVGLAEGRAEITPERVAINCMDARIPDNAGFQPQDKPIAPDGQTAYFSLLPIREITKAIQAEGIPAKISNTAGTYVCNALMYELLQAITNDPAFQHVLGGFIHVPATPDMGLPKETPTMELNQIVRALQIAVDVVSKHAAMK
nr:pyroglutamyl-peptidase I [Clostridia bacterium]